MTSPKPPVTPDIPFEEPQIPGVFRVDERREYWSVVVEHLTGKERARCDVWKDEVQNILIFSGLFSAVVTAFLVESYKSLQESTSETLLTRIAATLEHATNSTTAPSSAIMNSTPFEPTYTAKVINALWFLSLVLSLTTALVGVVSLQWLREHLRPSTLNTPLRTLPAMIQMQADSLDTYYVPQVFTTLPVLQILDLVLFFIGLIQFLWSINHAVAYPAVIAISSVLTFLLYTTLRPGLQGLPSLRQVPGDSNASQPTVPCPYKSPQSLAFNLALLFIIPILTTIFSPLRRTFNHLSSAAFLQSARPKLSQLLARTRPNIPKMSLSTLSRPTSDWIEWTKLWLRHRDVKYIHSKRQLHSLLEPFTNRQLTFPPVYDTLRALLQTKHDFSMAGSKGREKAMDLVLTAFADFLCFNQCSQGFDQQLVAYSHEVLGHSRHPAHRPFYFAPSLLKDADLRTQRYECHLLFQLAGSSNFNDIASTVSVPLRQKIIDLVLLSCGKLDTKIDHADSLCSPLAILWYEASRNANLDFCFDAVLRAVDKITSYAHGVTGMLEPDTLGTSPYVKGALHAISNIVKKELAYRESSVHKHDALLSTLHNHLLSHPHNPHLFLIVSIYAHYLLIELPPQFMYRQVYKRTKNFNTLAGTLLEQYTQLRDSEQLRQYQEWIIPHSLEPGFIWAYLDPRYDQDDRESKAKHKVSQHGAPQSGPSTRAPKKTLAAPQSGPSTHLLPDIQEVHRQSIPPTRPIVSHATSTGAVVEMNTNNDYGRGGYTALTIPFSGVINAPQSDTTQDPSTVSVSPDLAPPAVEAPTSSGSADLNIHHNPTSGSAAAFSGSSNIASYIR